MVDARETITKRASCRRRRRTGDGYQQVEIYRCIGVFTITLAVPFAAAPIDAITRYLSRLRISRSPMPLPVTTPQSPQWQPGCFLRP